MGYPDSEKVEVKTRLGRRTFAGWEVAASYLADGPSFTLRWYLLADGRFNAGSNGWKRAIKLDEIEDAAALHRTRDRVLQLLVIYEA